MEAKVGQDESNSKIAKIIFKEVSNRPAPPPFCSTPRCCACCPQPCRSLWHRHGLVGSSSWWGAALLPQGRMSIKWNRFSEVPQITVKLVGLKHWEVRAAWFLGSGILCCGVAAAPQYPSWWLLWHITSATKLGSKFHWQLQQHKCSLVSTVLL